MSVVFVNRKVTLPDGTRLFPNRAISEAVLRKHGELLESIGAIPPRAHATPTQDRKIFQSKKSEVKDNADNESA